MISGRAPTCWRPREHGRGGVPEGLGAMHALAHSIGGLLDSHHGLTIAIVMPYVLSANRAAISRPWRARPRARPRGAEPDGVLAWIMELRRRLQIPPTLEALGVREEHVRSRDARRRGSQRRDQSLPLDAPAYAALLRARTRGGCRPGARSRDRSPVDGYWRRDELCYRGAARARAPRTSGGRGGIGRRARFRSSWLHGRGGFESLRPHQSRRESPGRRVATRMPGGARCRSPSCRPRA